MKAGAPFPKAVAAFTAFYMITALVACLVGGNKEFVFYLVVMVVLIAAISIVHFRIELPSGLLWGLSIWGLLHMNGGLSPVPASWPISTEPRVFYNWWIIPGWLKYDQMVHAYGFALTTWLCWVGLAAAMRGQGSNEPVPTSGLMILCAAAGMGFGAFNEVIEFAAKLSMPQTNVGDYDNTAWDLVFNMLGSVIAAVYIALKRKDQGHQTAQE